VLFPVIEDLEVVEPLMLLGFVLQDGRGAATALARFPAEFAADPRPDHSRQRPVLTNPALAVSSPPGRAAG
jgi:hypothetical protein